MSLLQNIDYRIQGYYKVPIINTLGDISETDYYQSYDSNTDKYTGLMVKEIITTERNALGIPSSERKEIRFYKGDVVTYTKNIERIFTEENGYEVNQVSRQRLVDRASIYLFSSLISEYGAEQGSTKAYEFLNDIIIPKTEYTAGNRSLLITDVNNSTRDYMTSQRKTDINTILDVSYIPTP
jgi:hypothetical protein